jgi:CheY-like chemotaxis protein
MRAELSDNAWSEPVTHVRVLVADDDEGVRAHFASLLEGATGIASTLEAEDGAEAMQMGLQLRPEIAVLDLNMPRLSGVEVAQTLRAFSPRCELPCGARIRTTFEHVRAAWAFRCSTSSSAIALSTG